MINCYRVFSEFFHTGPGEIFTVAYEVHGCFVDVVFAEATIWCCCEVNFVLEVVEVVVTCNESSQWFEDVKAQLEEVLALEITVYNC